MNLKSIINITLTRHRF